MTASSRRGVRVLSKQRVCTAQVACDGAELRADYVGDSCGRCRAAMAKKGPGGDPEDARCGRG
jgi:hypothetical protein